MNCWRSFSDSQAGAELSSPDPPSSIDLGREKTIHPCRAHEKGEVWFIRLLFLFFCIGHKKGISHDFLRLSTLPSMAHPI